MKKADRMKSVEKSLIRKIYDDSCDGAINLGLGQLQFMPPLFLRETAKNVVFSSFNGYTSNAGLLTARQAIASYSNISNPDGICICNGAEEAIFATLLTYLNKDDEVIISNPYYPAYKTIIQMAEAKPVFLNYLPENNFCPDINSLKNIVSKKTKIMLLSNPCNPLGKSLSNEEIKAISDFCNKHNLLLIVDEVYKELKLTDFKGNFSSDEVKNLITIGSLSKSHCLTGFRAGWVASTKTSLIKPIVTTHQYISTCASFVSQKLIQQALSKKGLEFCEELRARLWANYKIVLEMLNLQGIRFLAADAAPYIFVNAGGDDIQLCKTLAKNGVILSPGSGFGSLGKNHIRINYALAPEMLRMGLNIMLNSQK